MKCLWAIYWLSAYAGSSPAVRIFILMKLLIATGKFNEISAILKEVPHELVSLTDTQVEMSDVIEDGQTYEENSFKLLLVFQGY